MIYVKGRTVSAVALSCLSGRAEFNASGLLTTKARPLNSIGLTLLNMAKSFGFIKKRKA
jgi:uncharacterized protein YjfI (DUF2170 family)